MRAAITLSFILALACGVGIHAHAADAGKTYASLDAGEVNMRTGPGLRYPIQWVFRRSGWPVEIVSEFGYWRKVRDIDGTTGWIHQNLLSGRRRVIVTEDRVTAHETADPDSPAVMRLEKGVVADLGECRPDWCWIAVANREGWVNRAALWGVGPVDQR